jgi:propanol-preferring alcohol dehydrogenase
VLLGLHGFGASAHIVLQVARHWGCEVYVFHERSLRSVTANTRADGAAHLQLAAEIPLRTHNQEFPLEAANEALRALKHDQNNGAAVLRVSRPAAG